jgi:hypothetical protein
MNEEKEWRACCKNCRFYRRDTKDGFGVCRRRAPVVTLTHTPPLTMFPDVADGVWCGEWQDELIDFGVPS